MKLTKTIEIFSFSNFLATSESNVEMKNEMNKLKKNFSCETLQQNFAASRLWQRLWQRC